MVSRDDDGFSQFDQLLKQQPVTESPWDGGRYVPSLDLFCNLLSLPISQGDKQESGRPAKAIDAWIAHELRRAGFSEDGVWPRNRRPRVGIEDNGDLERAVIAMRDQLAAYEAAGQRLRPQKLRSAINAVIRGVPGSSSAYVLGDFYSKQIDVGLSSWQRGPDILISTKTMFSGYGKNLKNRHEEAVGEVMSLRRRHPMATMGYAYLVRQDILHEPSALATLYDILRRLRREGEAFDATMLLVVDWDEADLSRGVTNFEQPADDLSASTFFTDLIEKTLYRTPSREHVDARLKHGAMAAGGLDPADDEYEEYGID